MSSPHTIRSKSSAVAREAEKRKGIPKLDSAVIGIFFESVNEGGAAHVLHLFLLFETSETILSSGVERSLESVSVVPSSQDTSIESSDSDFFTQRVVDSLAVASLVSLAPRPV
jgi:hypothetical protein